MLRKDLDFVPLSPKKAVVVGEDGAPLGQARGVGVARTRSRLVSDEEDGAYGGESEVMTQYHEGKHESGRQEAKTTDEKKLFLATMLGNVEALVEGVRKAGIWGLG
jgi:hypothetical protein